MNRAKKNIINVVLIYAFIQALIGMYLMIYDLVRYIINRYRKQ